MHRFLTWILWIALSGFYPAHAHNETIVSDQSCLRYLGNEGVMVTAGGSKILFDAFYANSYGQYALVPKETQQALIAGRPPYDHVDALFVSHVHGDHFSPGPTLAFLRANEKTKLYASHQVISVLASSELEDTLRSRLNAFKLAVNDPAQSMNIGPLSIDVVRIPHSGGAGRANIENLAFRVTLANTLTVLHLGDADPNDLYFAPHQAHWDAKTLNIAFPPYWFLGNSTGVAILNNRLKPQQTIGIHVPIAAAGKGDVWRHKYGGDLFTDPGEVRVLKGNACSGAGVVEE